MAEILQFVPKDELEELNLPKLRLIYATHGEVEGETILGFNRYLTEYEIDCLSDVIASTNISPPDPRSKKR